MKHFMKYLFTFDDTTAGLLQRFPPTLPKQLAAVFFVRGMASMGVDKRE